MKKRLADFLSDNELFQKIALSKDERSVLIDTIENEYLAGLLSEIVVEIEEIMAIDATLPIKAIMKIAAQKITNRLDAKAATIRLFNPKTTTMTSFGSYGVSDYDRFEIIPVKDSISGAVIKEKKSIQVASISKDPRYKNKEIIKRQGLCSLLALPLFQPEYKGEKSNLFGSLQIYYSEDNRQFAPMEVIRAELLARRLSYVLARKKIAGLQEMNRRKEQIVNKMFVKLSNREGIRLKDLFSLMIPELREFIQVQSCSLFTISDDHQFVRLDSAYPLDKTYHKIGHSFTIDHHQYFNIAIQGKQNGFDNNADRITPAYVLITNPKKSQMISRQMQEFVQMSKINSILLVPLKVENEVRHLLMFFAEDQKRYFTDEEIDLLTFFGKEIMKASKLEFMGDMLHDFKNPAIAVAGFAGRIRKLLGSDDLETVRVKLDRYAGIMIQESARMQDLALAMTGEGREELLDLSLVAMERFRINQEVILESRRTNIDVRPPEFEPELFVFCARFGLERVLDNLLNNATKAVPEEGGILAVRGFRQDMMVCLEVRNTGEILADKIEEIRESRVKGRGLQIISHFVQLNNGILDIQVDAGQTIITIKLPYCVR
ncbi:MAG: GAF domain-containing protein [Thermodesulfobacteriota bacterium]|nr:GAF domain-containing protein [Thermodesulfobacteriota bacterium]